MFLIRIPTDQDLTQLAQCVARDAAWVRYIRRQRRRNGLQMLIAVEDEQLIGFVSYRVCQQGRPTIRNWRDTIAYRWFQPLANAEPASLLPRLQVGLIEEICFVAQPRRHDHASALLQRCVQSLQASGVNEVQVRLKPDDEAAQFLLQELGFQLTRLLVHRQLTHQTDLPLSVSRPATRQDLPQLAALVRWEVYDQQRLSGYLHLAPDIDWVRYVTAKLRRPDIQILVSEQDGKLVGYVELRLLSSGRRSLSSRLRTAARHLRRLLNYRNDRFQPPRRLGVIEDIYIVPAFRRQNLGAFLLQDSFVWFRSRQVVTVHGSIWQANTVSLQFCQKQGFAVVEVVCAKR